MKKFFTAVVLLLFIFITSDSFAQDWLPKPVSSPYLDALEGTWVSEPYEFMGNTTNDVVTCKKILNGQYMEVDVKSSSKGFNYEGKEIIKVSSDGSMSGTYYDVFAKGPQPTTYSLSQDGNKLMLVVSGGESSRNVVIDGNTMNQDVTFKMGDAAILPEQKISIIYKKQ